jgi:peptide/nickel transport system substrate-binding protein
MAVGGDEVKRRWRRGFRRRRKGTLQLSQQADEQIERLLIRRFDRLVSVRRFIFLWVSLFLLLIFVSVLQIRALSPYYQTLVPAPGGIYSEGIIGNFSNANPIYATEGANLAVSRMVFSGLFKYDDSNKLTGDLAKDYVLDPSQKRYTVHLKRGLTWHDGSALTADDVVFTYQTIQNPETQSPLLQGWQGIKVSRQDTYTVVFDLSSSFGPFPYSLTNGIVPMHSLKKIVPGQMRSAPFNTAPVGAGPFVWKSVEVIGTNNVDRQQRISLSAFDRYWAGRPQLDGLNLTTFSDDQHLIEAFKKKQINAMSGLEALPAELSGDSSVHVYTTALTSIVMAFFNNSNQILKDANVRRALVSGVDRNQVPALLSYPVGMADAPLLRGQLGYDPSVTQLAFNQAEANKMLDQAGWTKDAQGLRARAGERLALTLVSQDTQEYTQVSQFLQRQWAELGVKVDVHYYNVDDLQALKIANHDYDMLLYGISIGVDPDVFAYWDSSQASLSSQGHLNLSEYKSKNADEALQQARTRADPNQRVSKYKIFLTSWTQDAPALALYQPNVLYITRGQVFEFQRKSANSAVDRFYNVHQWMVRQKKQNI